LPLSGGTPGVTVNGTAGLEPVIFDANALSATPTATGALVVNVDATSPIAAAGTLPSANVAGSVSAATSSVVVYGNLGEEVLIDFHYAQTAAGTWEVAAFDNSTRGPNGFSIRFRSARDRDVAIRCGRPAQSCECDLDNRSSAQEGSRQLSI
jgi:flagellar hook protein FlgE